jgi:hypothetical protein
VNYIHSGCSLLIASTDYEGYLNSLSMSQICSPSRSTNKILDIWNKLLVFLTSRMNSDCYFYYKKRNYVSLYLCLHAPVQLFIGEDFFYTANLYKHPNSKIFTEKHYCRLWIIKKKTIDVFKDEITVWFTHRRKQKFDVIMFCIHFFF